MDTVKGREVEIVEGYASVYFSGGEDGKDHEIGIYNFWVAEGEDEFGPWTVIGRALDQLSPADRFQRMDQERVMSENGEDRIAYQMIWDRFDTIQRIRPACMREIVRWAETHEREMAFAGHYAMINGEQRLIPRKMV